MRSVLSPSGSSQERRPLAVGALSMARFIALFIASVSSAEKAAYSPTPEEDSMWADGMIAWGDWMEKHSDSIVDAGSPLGATLRASPSGIAPHENRVVAYIVIEAASHQVAAEMFASHPHFSIMPGHSVEIVECLAPPSQR